MQDQAKKFKILYKSVIIFLIFITSTYAKNADSLYRDSKFAEAEKAYQQGDMDNPKDLRYRYNRGCAAFQNKDYKAAESAFTSVLRRAKDKDIVSRSAFNLGNTAFVQNDFASATEFYKQAVIFDPQNTNAKYNLELSIKKLEEAKQNPDKKDNKGDQKDKNKNSDQGDKSQDKKNQNSKNDQKNDKSKDVQNQDKNDSKDKKDLSGDLNSSNPMGEKPKVELSPAEMMERKKADALLDNIKEDRAKIMQFQAHDKNKGSAASGKPW
jgi:Ca-activated chloride channel homolog